MCQRHDIQLVYYTVSIDIFILDITGHYLSEGLFRTVFDVIFVLKQPDCLIAADRIVREVIILQIWILQISLLPVLYFIF